MDQPWRDRPKIGKGRSGCDGHLGHHRAKFPSTVTLYTKNQERLAPAIRWVCHSDRSATGSTSSLQTQSRALALLGAVGTDGKRTNPVRLQFDVS